MEATVNGSAHSVLLTSVFDPYLLILVTYLVFVVVQLVWLTRSAISDDMITIFDKPSHVKKRIAMALSSLAATWYYMIKYLFWSYSAYLERVQLTGGEITSIPLCGDNFNCRERVTAAKLMRLSSWLRETSLFEEAWLHVVGSDLNWWWSVEICTFTVAFWALHLKLQGRQCAVPYIWAYMLLGQTVAISVAMNLFEAAVITRSSIIHIEEELPQGEVKEDSEDEGLIARKRTAAHLSTIYSPPRYGDLLLSLSLIIAGLTSVINVPSSLLTILTMHVSPLLLVVPIPLPRKIVSRKWRWIASSSSIYAVIAAFSLLIRIKAHYNVQSSFSLLPTIFTSHPAQSSISADAVCLTLSLMWEIYEDQSTNLLWLFLMSIFGPSTIKAALMALRLRELEEYQEKTPYSALAKSEASHGQDIVVKTRITSTVFQKSRKIKTETESQESTKIKKETATDNEDN